MAKPQYRKPSENMKKLGEPTFSNKRVSTGLDSDIGEFYYISVKKLIPFKNQARKRIDEESIKSLANTIKEHGIRQPLTIIKARENADLYEVVSGERRLKAAILLEMDKVPCIILTDLKKAEEIAIIENIQREDLHPIEVGEAYKNLIEMGVCGSLQDVAKRLGVSKSHVFDLTLLANLPLSIKKILYTRKITRNLTRLLNKCSTEEEMMQLLTNSQPQKTILTIESRGGEYYMIGKAYERLSEEDQEKVIHVIKQHSVRHGAR